MPLDVSRFKTKAAQEPATAPRVRPTAEPVSSDGLQELRRAAAQALCRRRITVCHPGHAYAGPRLASRGAAAVLRYAATGGTPPADRRRLVLGPLPPRPPFPGRR